MDDDQLARDVPKVRRQRILVDLVFVDDGGGDDWQSQIVNGVLRDSPGEVYINTHLLEDVELVDGRDRVGAE